MAACSWKFDFSLCYHLEYYHIIHFLSGILAGAITTLWSSSASTQPSTCLPASRQLVALPACLMMLSLVMLSNHSASMLCHGAQLRHLTIFQLQRLVHPYMPQVGFRRAPCLPRGTRCKSLVFVDRNVPSSLIDDAVISQLFLSYADDFDLVSHVDIYDTALLSESQATSLRSLLSNFSNTGLISSM